MQRFLRKIRRVSARLCCFRLCSDRNIADQLKRGEPYENLKKCIHVSILDFIHFEKDTECYRTICFCDEKTGKKYTDLMEIQILELKKLPADIRSGDDLIKWMKFFGGKSRKEFAAMAKTDSFIEEAYKELEKLSADERAKLEYEARERAIRDYNSQMRSALRMGEQKGMERGIRQGEREERRRIIENQLKRGRSMEETAELLGLKLSEVRELARKEKE